MDHRKKQRKKLSCEEETFFETVLLVYGPPDPEARNYISNAGTRYIVQGVGVYLREHPRGKIFMQCVVTYGEAKARAGKWYYRYIQWWRENEQRHRGGTMADGRPS